MNKNENPNFEQEPYQDIPEQNAGYSPEEFEFQESYPELPPDAYVQDGIPEEEPMFDEAFLEQYNDDGTKKRKKSIFRQSSRKPNFVVSVLVSCFRILLVVLVCIVLAVAGAVIGIGKAYVETAPDLDLNLINKQAKTSFIYDANGELLTEYKGIENRVNVGIDYIPKNLQNAFVAAEDERFYQHKGVDVKRIVGAFISNFLNNSTQGGSTITQQLIKNTVLSSEMSYKRKIQEAYLALQLEEKYEKPQILEAYLNTIYLGENYYGVKVAAKGYFNKDLHELSLRECAMLAGVTSYPYYYNPHRNYYERKAEGKDYPQITNNRTNYVLRKMLENQFITQAEYDSALNVSSANVIPRSKTNTTYKYAHYIEYAIHDVIDVFLKMNNLEDTPENRGKMESEIRTGGYHIKLAIDTQMQDIVEDTLESWNNYPKLADKNDTVLRVKNADGTFEEIIQPQVAVSILDYRTGELKAIVGSRNRPTKLKTLNRAKDMNMPVGSSIKPIAVFAPAIDTGASPAEIAFNMPVPIEGWQDENKQDSFPKNYGGGSYTGFETLREAMRRSHNTSTASAFSMYVGVNKSVDYLKRLGVAEKNINATPFGLALGSSGITPVQMAVAYGVFGNAGVYQEPLSFIGISDSSGNVIYDAHQNQQTYQAVKPSTAWLLVDMLKDVVNSGTGANTKFKGQTIAGKTGTNSEHRGVTYTGMTGYYVSSIWLGHDNYKPLSSKATGGGAAGAIWKAYMEKIHNIKSLENKDILAGNPGDYGLVKVSTCPVSGQLATNECYHDAGGKHVVEDWWPSDSVPAHQCQMHRSVTICSASHKPVSPYCPQEYHQTLSGIVIPEGHPLYRFRNTQYADVIRQYTGQSTVFGYDELGFTDPSLSCDVHTEFGTQETQGNAGNASQIYNEAMNLLGQANAILQTQTDTGSQAYVNLLSATANLQEILNMENSSAEAIYAAMTELSAAMSAFN